MLNKTINLCKQTIEEACIKSDGVNKIILVGGPTQLPFIKSRLERDLSISVDTSSDPLTAVARGACIYATSEIIPDEFEENKIFDESVYEVKLNYESLTSEEEELITGIIPRLKNTSDEYFFQIQSSDNTFNTGKKLIKDGKIVANVVVKPNKFNSYWFYLFDKDGNTLNSSVDEFGITHGLSISGAPIPHSIGIGVSARDYATSSYKQKFEIFFEKNSILPLEKTISYKTIRTVRKGETDNCLPITVYEGENKIPEHNIFVCEIALTGKDINSNLYEGSQIDIAIKVDKSRVIEIEAYIPDLNQSINAKATIYDENLSVEKLQDDLDKEIDKIQEFEHLCSNSEKESIYKDISDIKKSLEIAKNDEDEKRKTNMKVKNLKAQINKLEESKNEDSLIYEYKELIDRISALITKMDNGSPRKAEFIKQFESITLDGSMAIQNKNTMLLSKIIEQLKDLDASIVLSDDGAWVYFLHQLAENPLVNRHPMLQKGFQALENGDMNMVRNCVATLMRSLPDDEQEDIQSKIAGITR